MHGLIYIKGGAPIVSWAWNFDQGAPDLLTSESANPWNNPEYPGDYQVRLKVTDSKGATSTLTRPVSVVSPPVTNIAFGSPNPVSLGYYEMRYYKLDVPAGLKSVTVALAQTRENDAAWLYLARSPSVVTPYCQSGMGMGWGNPAVCTITSPAAGAYFVIISGRTELKSSTLTATYAQ
jgi:serine protease